MSKEEVFCIVCIGSVERLEFMLANRCKASGLVIPDYVIRNLMRMRQTYAGKPARRYTQLKRLIALSHRKAAYRKERRVLVAW